MNSLIESSTILLLKDSPVGMRVFMVKRNYEIDGFPGALVFPGGKLDPGDGDKLIQEYCYIPDEKDEFLLEHKIAALRECFEESGIFIARDRLSGMLIDSDRIGELAGYRAMLESGSITFLDIIKRENLLLAVDQLTHFSHWITPKRAKRRYNTHFFAVKIPQDFDARHDGRESIDSNWISPEQLLLEAGTGIGGPRVVFPTRSNLSRLSLYDCADDLLENAKTLTVPAICPEIIEVPEGFRINIPDGAGYPLHTQVVPDMPI